MNFFWAIKSKIMWILETMGRKIYQQKPGKSVKEHGAEVNVTPYRPVRATERLSLRQFRNTYIPGTANLSLKSIIKKTKQAKTTQEHNDYSRSWY